MRKLKTIQTTEKLNYVITDDMKGKDNANYKYYVHNEKSGDVCLYVHFQNNSKGKEESNNVVTDFDLLEIVRDRLSSLQSGEFANHYNLYALRHIEEALVLLDQRNKNMTNIEILRKK